MQEVKEFRVHPAILHSIISAQAGTLAKGLGEAYMNAVDAGATKFRVKLETTGFLVKDDGRGFRSRQEIDEWFGTFGTPHQEGDATYGRFRMGRGQLMAFARTVWRTGEFEMDADVKNEGLNYRFKEGLKAEKGCAITGTLYKPLDLYGIDSVVREFTELIKYGQIPVSLNGKIVTTQRNTVKWSEETEDAYIKTDASGSLKVYNLGVLVRTYGAYMLGSGGVIVSKVPLKVNFARNDVLVSECEVWPRIVRHVKAASTRKVAKKRSMSDQERMFLVRSLLTEACSLSDFVEARVFTTATGVQASLRQMAVSRLPIGVVSSRNDRVGERLHRARRAFVLAQETLDRFGVDTLGMARQQRRAVRTARHGHASCGWHSRRGTALPSPLNS